MECNAQLHHTICQMIDYITQLAPETRIEDEHTIYEGEHANLAVYPPLSWTEEQCDELQLKIGEQISDLNVETGYLILVGVYSPREQVTQMQRELAELQKKIPLLEKHLSEAAGFDLLHPAKSNPELVPA